MISKFAGILTPGIYENVRTAGFYATV